MKDRIPSATEYMLMAKNKIGKVVLVRPGALGDVLAIRPVVRFFKESFPNVEVCLVAPGAPGRFLCQDGWVDRAYDWEWGAFSWLFGASDDAPAALTAVFGGSDIIISYMDFNSPEVLDAFEAKLNRIAPAAGKVFCPSKPHGNESLPIGEWLLRAAVGFCARRGLLQTADISLAPWLSARLVVEPTAPPFTVAQPYLAIHPGSGSVAKNWPVDHYAVLATKLLENRGRQACLSGLVVTVGEADSDLGRRLAEAVPGASLVEHPDLPELAAILAYAALYVGNDSGVSHLAAAVQTAEGGYPAMAVLFGPSDSRIWAPPGAVILDAGRGMDALSPDEAVQEIATLR